MLTGEIRWFNQRKNYGFITLHVARPDGKDVFLYGDEFGQDASPLKTGVWVTIAAVVETASGPRAEGVSLCKKRGEHERSQERERERKVLPFGTD